MPSEEDIALGEKRMYGDKREQTEVYVAAGMGLARVEIAGDQIGRFDLALRGEIRDVAGGGGRLVVAGEDVRVGTGDGFAASGFGAASAVGVDGERVLAAAPGGRVAVLRGDDWEGIGTVAEPRAMDGDLLAAADGVYRVAEELTRVGDAARDVAAAGPYAARADGLYRDGERVREGPHEVVVAAGERAHAVADGTLYERTGGDWEACALPTDERVVDAAYGESVYALTGAGTVLVDAAPETTPDGHGGWRSRALGVRDARRLAVP